MARDSITPELVRGLIDYDPHTGALAWRWRWPELFAATCKDPDRHCARWNSMFAGGPAFATDDGDGYLSGQIFGSKFYAHRVAWCHFHGWWPSKVIDHDNQVKTDNRIRNLFDRSAAENNRNKPLSSNSTSGATGVCWDRPRGNWRAYICHDGTRENLGSFAHKQDAIEARRLRQAELGFSPCHGK